MNESNLSLNKFWSTVNENDDVVRKKNQDFVIKDITFHDGKNCNIYIFSSFADFSKKLHATKGNHDRRI